MKFCAPPGTFDIRRVESCANTIRPTATIHVTSIEFVTGNPNGCAIVSALCDRPCSGTAPEQHGPCHGKHRTAHEANPCVLQRIRDRCEFDCGRNRPGVTPIFRMASVMPEHYEVAEIRD